MCMHKKDPEPASLRRNKAVYILKKNGVFYCIPKHMLILIVIVKLLFCSSRKKKY